MSVRLSSWLQPGEPLCGTCEGAGEKDGRTCPECRGFGSGPIPAGSPLAPAGTICPACGRPGTADDPVLTCGPVLVHRSHNDERRQRAGLS